MTLNLLSFESSRSDQSSVDGRLDERALADVIRGAAHGERQQFLKKLIAQILLSTTSDAVRDASALALVDLAAAEETDALLSVIRRPECARRCGTLLFALDELGASLPLDLAVSLIEHGSFEAKAEALIFIREGRVIFPDTDEATARLKQELVSLTQSDHPETAEAAAISFEYLARLPTEG